MTDPMSIVVTEVTNRHTGGVCVGGWCSEQGRMHRSLSGPIEHWDASLAVSTLFEVGNFLTMTPSGLTSGRGWPHSMEDLVVSGLPTLTGSASAVQVHGWADDVCVIARR